LDFIRFIIKKTRGKDLDLGKGSKTGVTHLEPALKYMSRLLIQPIMFLSVNPVELTHAHGQIPVRHLYQNMVMIIHQTISMAQPVVSPNNT
jgi:hypothetical protein